MQQRAFAHADNAITAETVAIRRCMHIQAVGVDQTREVIKRLALSGHADHETIVDTAMRAELERATGVSIAELAARRDLARAALLERPMSGSVARPRS